MLNLIVLGCLIIIVLIFSFFVRRRRISKKIQEIRKVWGKIPESPLDIESARIFFDLNKTELVGSEYLVDEDTWYDLDFNNLFELINRTTTPTGAQNLYYLMRHPVNQDEILTLREKLINDFSINQDLREKIQIVLQNLEEKNVKYLPYSLWQPLPERPFYAAFLPVLSLISFGVLLLVLLNVIHFGVLILVFVINFFIRSLIKKKIDIFIYAFQYLGVLINTAEKLSLLKYNELRDIQENLIKTLKDTKTIAKKIFTLQFKDELGMMEYLNIYFLWDISGFYSAIYKIRQHISELREMYMTIGYLDSMIAIASFRQEYPLYCRPSFNTKMFNVNDLYNPLLTKPVPNSFIFDTNNFLITGSNMSGKTTFLKTTGVNAILAQTIHTVMAESYEAPFLQVISSIGKEDNLLLGKSYYLAEVESILRLLKASESESIHLFILDEIFRGTNSVERLAASIEVLNYLANNKDYVLVATHDLQLSDFLKDNYKNFHFCEKVCDEGLTFDYKIHPGISTTRNAIALLKYVGYPQSIVENAFKRINKDE